MSYIVYELTDNLITNKNKNQRLCDLINDTNKGQKLK